MENHFSWQAIYLRMNFTLWKTQFHTKSLLTNIVDMFKKNFLEQIKAKMWNIGQVVIAQSLIVR